MRILEYLVQVWTGGECGEYITCKRTTTNRDAYFWAVANLTIPYRIIDVSVWAD